MQIKPRAYQQAIFETAKKHNTLVVLPTGLGKTLPAVMLVDYLLKKSQKTRALILAPTRPLVSQWLEYFKKYSSSKNKEIHLLTGKINAPQRKEIWAIADIILSTPQCIQNDLRNNLIDLKNVGILIEDECHRCVKNYSYTYVVEKYIQQAKNQRIIGLTASPSSDPKIVRQICKNLCIKAIEIRTRESDDVKPYLQKLTQEIVKVELPSEIKKINEPLHEQCENKIKELKNRKLLFAPSSKTNILTLQKKLQKMVFDGNNHFNILRGISVCAQVIKLQHLIELLETQSIKAGYEYMHDIFEQARQNKSKAAKQIANSAQFNKTYLLLNKALEKGIEHPKLEKIKQIMLKESRKKNSKVIIFSQYRNTINKINNQLTKQGIKSKIFIGQAKRKTSGLSQKEQQFILNEFKEGKINCLVSSSVGEEGLDIPEVDLIIFYEPIASAIRTVQRRGRTARLNPGKLIVLLTKGTKDESYYWASFHNEKKMYKTMDSIKESLKKQNEKKQQKEINDF